ncbi:hypothetical protein ETH_00043170, partial [Eimeria tenella]
RGVVPQLLQRLQQLEIRPQQQDLTPFNDVLLWESLLPTELLARVLHEGFMRQWLHVLRLWLSAAAANPTEIRAWFKAWQALLPQPLLQHPLIERGFTEALKLIGGGAAVAAAQLQQQQQQAPAAAPPPTPEQQQDLSLLELLQGMAAERGLCCRPKIGRVERGHQVYVLSRISFFVDGSVIMAKHKSQGPWLPFSAEQLFQFVDQHKK